MYNYFDFSSYVGGKILNCDKYGYVNKEEIISKSMSSDDFKILDSYGPNNIANPILLTKYIKEDLDKNIAIYILRR